MSSTDGPTPFDVRKLARLARLDIAHMDVPTLTDELASILEHARGLDALDLGGVQPLSHPADLDATLAADEAQGELPHDALERICPAMDGPFIRVPKVLGGQGGA
ncbi:MAG: Asp-tRNA(Asn)/Glu-tRNA(Gln) amidotransferase subunit GatC [Phycisphaerales bacterium JB060]